MVTYKEVINYVQAAWGYGAIKYETAAEIGLTNYQGLGDVPSRSTVL